MVKKKVDIIFNPNAGAGRASKFLPVLCAVLLTRKDIDAEIHLTGKQGEATEIAGKLVRSGSKLVVAAGGDGTVNEVLNGMFDDGNPINPDCELGILRCGTGQGAALSLHIPPMIHDQLDLLVNPHSTPIDLGKVKFTDARGKFCERYFISECQIGIGCAIASEVHNKAYRFFNGKTAFGLASFRNAVFFKSKPVQFSVDDAPEQSAEVIGIAAGNGAVIAGGMQLTPGAIPNDGLFDFLFIHKMSFCSRMVNFPKIYSGKHIHSKRFTYMRGRKITINSNHDFCISADGEVLGKVPCTISVIPSGIRIKSNYN